MTSADLPQATPSLHMARALALAESALYLTSPNPRVGCVLVREDGLVIGEGQTQRAGQAHAEVMALRDATAKGHLTAGQLPKGTTAYVTLEPCSHKGRTGACSQALINSGLDRVVASLKDPNPLVAGRGFAALKTAGIQVDMGDGAAQALELNIGFIKRMTAGDNQGLPWVRMKAAASLDGITALPNGQSQWITGEAARIDGHHWRARACAVLTGIGTVLADNPSLDVRHVATPRQPTLVLVDSKLEVPLSAHIFQVTISGKPRPIWIYTAADLTHPAVANKVKALELLGAEVIHTPNPTGKVDLTALLVDLGKRQINELHVEAGFKLNGSFWRAGLVDELLLYQNAQLMGAGQGIANLGTHESLAQTPKLRYHSVDRIGADLRIIARKIANKIK
ncbi:MAG: bifunctional diaminohydroxyphosphoribosylaminopyrimidine deaminase/5-amino-6-(5-phosphoribosylamino)uracil reductase RibD [Cytophagales bacterium]|nr:bifunctional diaminohydroxyphosphoribosylaminopyrimidine deaminase/5-amino-6-(5-phosphoribosylamino)uracil reductase RibD [Cytophagales bacterium]